MNLTRVYDFLLRLYPRRHREAFAAEMAAVFAQAAAEYRSRGATAYAWFATRELAGAIVGAAAAWTSPLTRRPQSERAIPSSFVLSSDVREVERILQVSIDRMVYAIANHQFVEARFYSLVERKARARLDQLRGTRGD
jgi:hypothetical protein